MALTFGLAVGCGGISSGPSTSSPTPGGGTSNGAVAVDSAALTDTATESADLAASLSSDDMTMNVGGFGGISSDNLDSHTELVGSLLMAFINPHSCTSGTASITMAPAKTSPCPNIGVNGMYPGGATIAFNQCVLRNGATIDGSIVIDETRALASGQMCGASAVFDDTRSVTIAKLSFTAKDKAALVYSNVSVSALDERALNARPTSVTTKVSGERSFTDSTGMVKRDHTVDSMLSIVRTDKTATAPASTTFNGTSTVTDKVANTSYAVDLKDVEKVRSCCRPIAGTITVTHTPASGAATTNTVAFGPMCGDVTVDGKPVTGGECM
jgi:hypothetical protein